MINIFRRRKAAAVPEATAPEKPEPDEPVGPTIVMRFRTQGGAPVELYAHSWTLRLYRTEGAPPELRPESGYNWRCTGCAHVGRDSIDGGYAEPSPTQSKRDANTHAADCHAMPAPGGDA